MTDKSKQSEKAKAVSANMEINRRFNGEDTVQDSTQHNLDETKTESVNNEINQRFNEQENNDFLPPTTAINNNTPSIKIKRESP